jgi:hypothetical protein
MDPSVTWPWLAMNPVTKTYLSLGLVALAVFEYVSAMRVLGRQGPKSHARLSIQLHRAGGYVFLAYFVWISWVCFDMMGRLATAGGYELDARGVWHGALAFTLIAVLLLKISFVRSYGKFRPYVPLLGMILTLGTLVLWGVAGWMFLWLVGGVQTVTPGG